jgi:hypothetical protein
MTSQIQREYLKARKAQTVRTIDTGRYVIIQERASDVLRAVKIRAEWSEAESQDLVRLRVEPDQDLDLSYLDQDCYTDRYRAEVREHAERDGGTGIIGEYYDGETWQSTDSVWGFIGDDWKGSGYDIDIMRATLDALAELDHCPTCGRPRKA